MENTLKERIRSTFNAPVNSAKDCELLSDDISNRTKRMISSTTIRRFLGLMPSKSRLSKYNKDTLAIYCGYSDYNSFAQQVQLHTVTHLRPSCSYIKAIHQITDYSIKSVVRKCLTDFDCTIPRDELNEQLDGFIESTNILFPLIAPGGYGKSVGLTHWVKKNRTEYDILFTQAAIFQQYIAQHHSMALDLNPLSQQSIFTSAEQVYNKEGRKLVFVVDAIDEISHDAKALELLVNYLLDIAHHYKSAKFLKLIISVREATWANLLEAYKTDQRLRLIDQGSFSIKAKYQNIPLLQPREIQSILKKANQKLSRPISYESISFELREKIKIPILLHYFIDLRKNVHIHDIITPNQLNKVFIKSLIFNSKYAEQKEDIVWKIIEIIDSGDSMNAVSKSKLKEHYPIHLKREMKYYHAYQELLAYGIIGEERRENKFGIFETILHFKHQNFFYYFSTLYLIKKNGGISNHLFQMASESSKSMEWKANVMATLFEIAYEHEELEALKHFPELKANILGTLPVRFAVGTSFRTINAITAPLVELYAANPVCRAYFFEQFVDTNYLFPNYVQRITAYLKHSTTDEERLFAHSILFLAAFLQKDFNACHHHFKSIDAIEPDKTFHPWPIGRKVASLILYQTFILQQPINDLSRFISHYQRIAYDYDGYLSFGLAAYELPISVALVLTGNFMALEQMLEKAVEAYHIAFEKDDFYGLIANNQNALLPIFLMYARIKTGSLITNAFFKRAERVMNNYSSAYDDFQYQIILKWMLFDLYCEENNLIKAEQHFLAAVEISEYAQYDYLTYFLIQSHSENTKREVFVDK